MNEAKSRIPEEFRNMITIDEIGNLSFAPELDDASKEDFAKIAKGFGFTDSDNFVDKTTQFFDPATSSLGEDFASLSETELNVANNLRNAANAEGLKLSDEATGVLAASKVTIEKTYDNSVARAEEDYRKQEAVYSSDTAALKAAQAKSQDPYQHMMDMGLNEYEASYKDKEASGKNLRKLIADTLESGFTNSEIILAMDASTIGEGWLEDNQVDVERFNDFLAVQVNDGLKQRANKVDDMLAAADKRDEAITKFDLTRRNSLSTAKTGAMKASGQRNSAANVMILNKALGIK